MNSDPVGLSGYSGSVSSWPAELTKPVAAEGDWKWGRGTSGVFRICKRGQ